MSNKDFKKKRDKASNIVTLRFSHSESAVLEKMMEKEEWSNRSGFIKYKIFGDSEDYQYNKMLESGEPGDIQKVLVALMTELNKQIDYLNYRFDSEIIDLKKKTEKFDETKVKQWVTFLQEWKAGLLDKTDDIFFDCQTILRAINVDVERMDFKDIRKLPDYILDKLDTETSNMDSPEMQEKARRLFEKFYSDNPNIAATRSEIIKKSEKQSNKK